MGTIINFSPKSSAKMGFKRARKRNRMRERLERKGQLNLFVAHSRVLSISGGLSTFEQALMLDDRGDPAAADRYRKAIEENDLPADALCNLGILESANGKKNKAFDCFTRSLTLQPRHFESHYNLGNLYFDSSDYILARTHYEFAMEINPEYPNLYFNLGLVLAIVKEYRLAVRTLQRYAELASDEDAMKAKDLANRIVASAAKDGT